MNAHGEEVYGYDQRSVPTIFPQVADEVLPSVAGVLVQDQAFGDFSNGPNTITGNLGGTDVACVGQFPVTLNTDWRRDD